MFGNTMGNASQDDSQFEISLTIREVIRVTAENFRTPCRGILSTAAAADGVLTPQTLVDYCNTRISLATAEQLGLVRRNVRGEYIEVPSGRRAGRPS